MVSKMSIGTLLLSNRFKKGVIKHDQFGNYGLVR